MNTIRILEKISKEYLLKYEKNFNKLYKKLFKGNDSVINEYYKWNKYTESWPLQSRYSDYDFLSNLDRKEKDKYILMFSIYTYIQYIYEVENMNLNKEYLCYLEFNLDELFFIDQNELLFPYVNYYIAKSWETEIKKIDWHEWITLNKSWDKWFKYINKLIQELWLKDYIDINEIYFNNWYSNDYNIKIDFNFKVSINKKRLKLFL